MKDLFAELNAAPKDNHFSCAAFDLMVLWRARGVGLDGVEAILAFIQRYPDLDHGMPGPLVHFAEEFHRKGYEAALLSSFARQPTPLTAWMVNRLLNGAGDQAEHDTYVAALRHAATDRHTNAAALAEVDDFLSRVDR